MPPESAWRLKLKSRPTHTKRETTPILKRSSLPQLRLSTKSAPKPNSNVPRVVKANNELEAGAAPYTAETVSSVAIVRPAPARVNEADDGEHVLQETHDA